MAGECGLAFTVSTLADVIRQALLLDPAERAMLQAAAMGRVQERYSWDAITTEYEALFARLVG